MMLFSRKWEDPEPIAHSCLWEEDLGAVEVEQNHKQLLWGPQTLVTVVTPLN